MLNLQCNSSLPGIPPHYGICHNVWPFSVCPHAIWFKKRRAAYCRLVQRMIDMLGVEGVLAYLDDLLIHTDDLETHLKLLELVLQAHQESGIKLNADKTFLFRT